MKCKKCGSELQEGQKFCVECGTSVEIEDLPVLVVETIDAPESRIYKTFDDEYDRYRNILINKTKTERYLVTATSVGILFLTGLYCFYTQGEGRMLNTLIIGAIISAVSFAIYGLIAGNMGVYEAAKYLKQYDIIKYNVGKKSCPIY